MIAMRNLAGRLRELVTDSAFRIRNPVVDGGSGRPRFETGLEAQVVEQS